MAPKQNQTCDNDNDQTAHGRKRCMANKKFYLVSDGAVQRGVADFRVTVVLVHIRAELEEGRHDARRRIHTYVGIASTTNIS